MSESDGIDEAIEGITRVGLTVAGRLGEQLSRAREQALRRTQAAEEQQARELQARFDAERAAARAQLAPFTDERWWDTANSRDIERVHATATAWKAHDPAAQDAATTIQEQLERRYGVNVDDLRADEASVTAAGTALHETGNRPARSGTRAKPRTSRLHCCWQKLPAPTGHEKKPWRNHRRRTWPRQRNGWPKQTPPGLGTGHCDTTSPTPWPTNGAWKGTWSVIGRPPGTPVRPAAARTSTTPLNEGKTLPRAWKGWATAKLSKHGSSPTRTKEPRPAPLSLRLRTATRRPANPHRPPASGVSDKRCVGSGRFSLLSGSFEPASEGNSERV